MGPFGVSLAQGLASSSASSGSSGLISGAIGQIFAGANARREWRFKQKEMALQQKYALEQMQKQSELSYGQWQKQFDYQNAYNDPSKVFERYLAAGVNPSAVLGSSGVGVNATLPGGSAGMPSASGPSGGTFGSYGAPIGDPTALAQNMTASAAAARDRASADLYSAQANDINARNFGREAFKMAFDLENQLLEANITESSARARYFNTISDWQDARNVYKDLIATAEWQKCVGELALIVENYNRLKADNHAYIPIADQVAAANVGYILASTRSLNASAKVNELDAQDIQNWLTVNWKTEIDVPEVDKNGSPTGQTRKMTGFDIAAYLLGIQYTAGAQGIAARDFENWQKKHPMLIGITQSVANGASTAAGVVAGRRMGTPRNTVTRTSYSDRNGEFIGGTLVQKNVMY
ncbi:DNA pilot protein [Sigmofec virus UA08Rod_4820]|uniref:DNA pilot protein n=1 Tax=Sigmofec virus UA08Rod_4820 TaxID=2929410 RepID=A0A976R7F8_9VIRU|nr:DNA pilot protein [Sigmofec virus UA08Rod_4820]